MWLAHLLTLSRLPIAAALWWTYGDVAWSLALLALAAATDAADGNVARWMQRRGHTRPAIGGWLDPLVDKIFIVSVLALLWFEAGERLVVVLVAVREVALVPVAVAYLAIHRELHRPVRELHADALGKATTIAQLVTLAAVFGAPPWALPAAVATAALGLGAAAHYAVCELRPRPREPGSPGSPG